MCASGQAPRSHWRNRCMGTDSGATLTWIQHDMIVHAWQGWYKPRFPVWIIRAQGGRVATQRVQYELESEFVMKLKIYSSLVIVM